MNLVDSIGRGLNWLSTPRYVPGRLEMETQRWRQFEFEVVSFAIRMPDAGLLVKLPVFLMVVPAGSSPIDGSRSSSARDDSESA